MPDQPMTYSEALSRIREIDKKYGRWIPVTRYSEEDQAEIEKCRQVVREAVLGDPDV